MGFVFLGLGVLGFIPGVTTNYDSLATWSYRSDALLLGILQVSVLHNVVHLLFGVAGIYLARTIRSARRYLTIGGVIYLVLFTYGLVIDLESPANFVPLDVADIFLHFVAGIAMLGLGLTLTRRPTPAE